MSDEKRIKLTKRKSQTLRQQRERAKVSQKEAGEALGWTRSRIKRIELKDLKTIDQKSLQLLEDFYAKKQALKAPETSTTKSSEVALEAAKTLSKKKEASKKQVATRTGAVHYKELFTSAKLASASYKSKNQIFYHVVTAEDTFSETLLGSKVVFPNKVEGSIHGLHTTKRNSGFIPKGQRFKIMVWGRNLAQKVYGQH